MAAATSSSVSVQEGEGGGVPSCVVVKGLRLGLGFQPCFQSVKV